MQATHTMAFSDGQTDKHTVFWNGAAPSSIWHINAWYRDGKVNGTGSGSISQMFKWSPKIVNFP